MCELRTAHAARGRGRTRRSSSLAHGPAMEKGRIGGGEGERVKERGDDDDDYGERALNI